MKIILNAYAQCYDDNNTNDLFPVNTYYGNVAQVLKAASNIFENENSGIARIEFVVNPEHPNYSVGQAPQDLSDEMDLDGEYL